MALDLDSDCYEPYLTHEVIKYDYTLEFPAESITVQPLALCIESRWGYSGPHIWSHSYRSNFTEERLRIASIDSASSIVDECVMALSNDWANASKFILDQVGFPDARPEQGIRSGFMDEVDYGHRISINLPESELQQILTQLRKVDHRHARLFEGLENQDSAFGRILYSWAEAICADEAIQYDLIEVLDGQEERTHQEYREHEEAQERERRKPRPGLDFDPNVTNPFTGKPYNFD
jgi:hypothetical protein